MEKASPNEPATSSSTVPAARPSATLNVNLFIFLNVNITNRLTSAFSNTLTGISFTADNGAGPQPITAPATLMGPGTLVFNGATFTLSSSGAVTLQLTGLRGAANELDFDSSKSMQVLIGLNPNTEFSLPTDQLVVGYPAHGLYMWLLRQTDLHPGRISVAQEHRRASPVFWRPALLSPPRASRKASPIPSVRSPPRRI